MNILFVGTSDLGIPTLEALVAQGTHTVRIITKPDAPSGRGRKFVAPPVKRAALDLGLEFDQPSDINGPEGAGLAEAFGPQVILVASYAVKISEAFLDRAAHRGINIHPSLLPRYRGAAPAAAAILNGDTETGVSIIRVAPRMDAGEILGQIRTPIAPTETAGALLDRLSHEAAPLVLDVLDRLAKDACRPVAQDESLVVKAPRFAKSDGLVDWECPAKKLDCFVRAMTPWPGAFTFLDMGTSSVRLTLLGAIPLSRPAEGGADRPAPGALIVDGHRLLVACTDGALEIKRLQKQGKKPMDAVDFLRGARLDPAQAYLCGPRKE